MWCDVELQNGLGILTFMKRIRKNKKGWCDQCQVF